MCVCVCVSICVRVCLFTSACPWFRWIVTTVPHGASANYTRAELVSDTPPERRRGKRVRHSKHGSRICDYMCVCSYKHEITHPCMNTLYSRYTRWPTCLPIQLRSCRYVWMTDRSANLFAALWECLILISVWRDAHVNHSCLILTPPASWWPLWPSTDPQLPASYGRF